MGRPSVAGHGAEGRRVRGDDKRRRRKQRRQGGMRAPCSGRRTPDRSPAAALRARINERQDETREMTRRRGCGCLRGRTSRGSRGFSDRGGAAALRKRADRRATGRGGKARLPGGAALKSAILPEARGSDGGGGGARDHTLVAMSMCSPRSRRALPIVRAPDETQLEPAAARRPCCCARLICNLRCARCTRAARAREREREEERGERKGALPLIPPSNC